MTKKLYFIHQWLKCKKALFKFFLIIPRPPNSFSTLPIVQWHQVLLWCCHMPTMSRLVSCLRPDTNSFFSFICFNYFCRVTANTQLRGRSFMVVTYKQKEWRDNNTSALQHPTAFSQQQQWGCMILSSRRQGHSKPFDGVRYGERRSEDRASQHTPALLLQHGFEGLVVKKNPYPMAL